MGELRLLTHAWRPPGHHSPFCRIGIHSLHATLPIAAAPYSGAARFEVTGTATRRRLALPPVLSKSRTDGVKLMKTIVAAIALLCVSALPSFAQDESPVMQKTPPPTQEMRNGEPL